MPAWSPRHGHPGDRHRGRLFEPGIYPEEPAMWLSMPRTAAATVAYGLVHSTLADDAVRRRVRDLAGPRAYDGRQLRRLQRGGPHRGRPRRRA